MEWIMFIIDYVELKFFVAIQHNHFLPSAHYRTSVVYFQCPPKQGLFVHLNRISQPDTKSPSSPPRSSISVRERTPSSAIPSPLQQRRLQKSATSASGVAGTTPSTVSRMASKSATVDGSPASTRPASAARRVSQQPPSRISATTSLKSRIADRSTSSPPPSATVEKRPSNSTSKSSADRISAHVEVVEAQNALLSVELAQAKEKLAQLQSQTDSNNKAARRLSSTSDPHGAQVDLQDRIEQLRKEKAQLESRCEQYNAALQSLTDEHEQERKSMTEKMMQYKDDVEKVLASRQQAWERELSDVATINKSLQAENLKLKEDLDLFKEQIAQELTVGQSDAVRLNHQLTEKDREILNLRERIELDKIEHQQAVTFFDINEIDFLIQIPFCCLYVVEYYYILHYMRMMWTVQ